jgi:parallel beta-helix repeat protein
MAMAVTAGLLIAYHISRPLTVMAPVGAPTTPTRICGQKVLHSPYSYDGVARTFTKSGTPGGLPTFGKKGTFPLAKKIVVVPAGNNTVAAGKGDYGGNDTIYYFEPGRHIIQGGMYTGVQSVYIGGYGSQLGLAVIDGVNGATPNGLGGNYLSSSNSHTANADETWEFLTIKNYTSSVNDAVLGNENGAGFDNGNVYKYDTIGPNLYGYRGDNVRPGYGEGSGGGYAVGFGDRTVVADDCLTWNAQGAFNGVGRDITISGNEISRNGLGEYPDSGGNGGSPYACGCSGGGKLFFSVNPVITYNYVHDNYNNGIWLDFDNTGADVSYNYISSNWGIGILYEASYNANISHNTLVGNGWASDGAWPAGAHGGSCDGGVTCRDGMGPVTGRGGGFPYAAIYLPNSGGNSNLSTVPIPGCASCAIISNYRGELLVQDNVLINNFGQVSVYTDTDRYPGNIDNDSACSVPFGALSESDNPIYYQQTLELQTNADATISGTSVTSIGGTQRLCSDYGVSRARGGGGGNQSIVTHAPTAGMAVFDIDTGVLVGVVTSVASVHDFTLRAAAPSGEDKSGASLLLSAYGGCGPADYFGAGHNRKSGLPSAYYWDNCIWGSRNVTVTGNTFMMTPSHIRGCTTANMCGYTEAMAFNAGVPALVQYFDAYPNLIAKASGGLGVIWSKNKYVWSGAADGGRWPFMTGLQGNQVTLGQWRSSYRQDAGSSFSQ